jgi:selenocysteine lyase/cysteine desulfurase
LATDRRKFLHNLLGIAGAAALSPIAGEALSSSLHQSIDHFKNIPPYSGAGDEAFWHWVQQAYTESPTLVNLNNGGVSPQPKVVQEAFEMYNRQSNQAPSYYMWRVLNRGRESLREKLANLAGCSPEEIVINRNTTEALDTIIFGLNLEKGDEIVVSNFDYPNMYNAWKQREKRDGVKLVEVKLDMPMESDDEIVKRYTEAFTNKTKIVHITHLINWTGQLIPAKRIAQEARKKGIEVIVDGAHSFAHIDYKISDLECDYYGTSLHKWLCAPFGSGMLYVKKDKIANLWPTCPNGDPNGTDIKKFENLGTRSYPAEFAIGHAIDFHLVVGTKRKQERLQYLKKYWLDQVKDLPGVNVFTSLLPQYSCALATVGIDGMTSNELMSKLFDGYQIHVTTIDKESVSGVRITPHIYTKISDLDKLVRAFKEITRS